MRPSFLYAWATKDRAGCFGALIDLEFRGLDLGGGFGAWGVGASGFRL